MAYLRSLAKEDYGRVYSVPVPLCNLGRARDCQLSDLFRGQTTVSRYHAAIKKMGDEFLVVDLNSHNGTLVNGHRISEPVSLREGDRLEICGSRFVFHVTQPKDKFAYGADAADSTHFLEGEESSSIESSIDVTAQPLSTSASADVRLSALTEMLSQLGASLDQDDVLDSILNSLLRIFVQADRGFIGLRESPGKPLQPKAVRHRHAEPGTAVTVSRTIANQVMDQKKAIRSKDVRKDARIPSSDSISHLPMRSVMCAPLIGPDDAVFGILQLDTADQQRYFREEDLDVLVAVSGIVSTAIQYSRLHRGIVAWRLLKHDLDVARRIQRCLLPHAEPDVAGYGFHQHYCPAREVGGDYFDYLWLPDGRCAAIVADAESKGVSAALLMTVFSEHLKCSLNAGLAPDEAMSVVNSRISATGHTVTLVMTIVDPASARVTVLNAGHFEPVLRRRNGAIELPGTESKGLPFGVEDEWNGRVTVTAMEKGDALVMFSDGFTDAEDVENERYGLPRLNQCIAAATATTAEGLGQLVVDDVERFMGEQDQFDDMCLVCIHRC